ncbi:odorant-binding protein-like [Manis javanica]|uniref:odorant-binding protein-like n=1 Tax=Manis javanica TaxID=9974 RepID=UPI003C6DB569
MAYTRPTSRVKIHLQVSFSLQHILKIYGDHTAADGKKTVFTELLVKRRDVSKEDYEEFKVFTESKGIRAENILEVIKEDTCPLTIG